MRNKARLIIGVLIAVLALVGVMAVTSTAASPAKVKPMVVAARSGNEITYSVYLVNESSTAAKNIYLAGKLPSGAKFNVAASGGKGSSAGTVVGDVVAWTVTEVPANKTIGPFTYKVTASQGDVSAVNAWVRWMSPAEGSAGSNLASAEFQLAKMRSIAIWDNEIYPDKKSQITLSKGYGYNNSNNIITSGLPSVGVGEYAYFEGAEEDASLEHVSAWSWELVEKPAGSKASIEGASTRTPRLLTDVAGKYVARLTVTNAKGATSSSSISVSAGKYVGVALCASCHDGSIAEDKVSEWAETGHATKVEVTFASYSGTSDYCIKCHSVGFNETARNGGLDDAARAAGWNPANGSFLGWVKDKGLTLADVKNDPSMGSLINIQCENCHGPGGSHTQAKSYDPGTCNQCHGQGQQWESSGHNRVDEHMSGNPSCVKCHTGQGFVTVQAKGKEAVFPNAATPDKPANMLPQEEQIGIGCPACHDSHAATDPFKDAAGNTKSLQLRFEGEVKAAMGWSVDAHVSATCVKCHANNRTPQNLADFVAGKRNRGTHENTQADIYYGKGAFDYGEKFTNSAHTTVVTEGCVTCHMAPNPATGPGPDGQLGTRDDPKVLSAGGHSFNMVGENEGKKVENTGACKSCHGTLTTFNIPAKGDYDGDGKIEGVQDEVQGLMDVLAEKLPRDADGAVLNYPVDNNNSTAEQRKAIWNYNLVKIDNSKGIHNTAFTVQLLQKTYKKLTGTDVPGATLR